jgi:hypothetical protein
MSQASTRPTAFPGSRRVWWNEVDRHRRLTMVAALGLVLAGMLAVFGLLPVDLHAPPHYLGVMSPSCGLTRGVRLVVRDDLAGAVEYNPAAPLVVLGAVVALARHAVGWGTGRWLDVSARWTRLLVALTAAVLVVLWARQQAHVDLLTSR